MRQIKFEEQFSKAFEFKFKISNDLPQNVSDDESVKIENIINKFIEDKEIINIQINNIDSNYLNNKRLSSVILIYTIIFKNNLK
jgi:hypothetical protein